MNGYMFICILTVPTASEIKHLLSLSYESGKGGGRSSWQDGGKGCKVYPQSPAAPSPLRCFAASPPPPPPPLSPLPLPLPIHTVCPHSTPPPPPRANIFPWHALRGPTFYSSWACDDRPCVRSISTAPVSTTDPASQHLSCPRGAFG